MGAKHTEVSRGPGLTLACAKRLFRQTLVQTGVLAELHSVSTTSQPHEESIEQAPKSVEALTPLVDRVFTIANNDKEPIRLEECDWSEFSATWEHSSTSEKHQEDQELVCDMANVWEDGEHHNMLRDLWGKSYLTFCPAAL